MNNYNTLSFIIGGSIKIINNYNIKFLTLISNFTIFIVDNNNNPADKAKNLSCVDNCICFFLHGQNTYITITAT